MSHFISSRGQFRENPAVVTGHLIMDCDRDGSLFTNSGGGAGAMRAHARRYGLPNGEITAPVGQVSLHKGEGKTLLLHDGQVQDSACFTQAFSGALRLGYQRDAMQLCNAVINVSTVGSAEGLSYATRPALVSGVDGWQTFREALSVAGLPASWSVTAYTHRYDGPPGSRHAGWTRERGTVWGGEAGASRDLSGMQESTRLQVFGGGHIHWTAAGSAAGLQFADGRYLRLMGQLMGHEDDLDTAPHGIFMHTVRAAELHVLQSTAAAHPVQLPDIARAEWRTRLAPHALPCWEKAIGHAGTPCGTATCYSVDPARKATFLLEAHNAGPVINDGALAGVCYVNDSLAPNFKWDVLWDLCTATMGELQSYTKTGNCTTAHFAGGHLVQILSGGHVYSHMHRSQAVPATLHGRRTATSVSVLLRLAATSRYVCVDAAVYSDLLVAALGLIGHLNSAGGQFFSAMVEEGARQVPAAWEAVCALAVTAGWHAVDQHKVEAALTQALSGAHPSIQHATAYMRRLLHTVVLVSGTGEYSQVASSVRRVPQRELHYRVEPPSDWCHDRADNCVMFGRRQSAGDCAVLYAIGKGNYNRSLRGALRAMAADIGRLYLCSVTLVVGKIVGSYRHEIGLKKKEEAIVKRSSKVVLTKLERMEARMHPCPMDMRQGAVEAVTSAAATRIQRWLTKYVPKFQAKPRKPRQNFRIPPPFMPPRSKLGPNGEPYRMPDAIEVGSSEDAYLRTMQRRARQASFGTTSRLYVPGKGEIPLPSGTYHTLQAVIKGHVVYFRTLQDMQEGMDLLK